jgi:hypothetical protein
MMYQPRRPQSESTAITAMLKCQVKNEFLH